jgi:hypothetical protein
MRRSQGSTPRPEDLHIPCMSLPTKFSAAKLPSEPVSVDPVIVGGAQTGVPCGNDGVQTAGLFHRTVAPGTGLPPSVSTTPLNDEQIPGEATRSHALQT